MKSLAFISWFIACLASFCPAFCGAVVRPNILFFLVDDMGMTDTSVPFIYDAEGKPVKAPLNARYRTPNMERLASQGRKFTNARACSVCTPTRVSLMTGLDASRLHITTWTHPQRSEDTGAINTPAISGPPWRVGGLDLSLPALPKLFASSGYRTIHCGKAHFGPNDAPAGDPENLGFQVNIGGHGAGGPGSYWGSKNFSAAWRQGGNDWDVPGLDKYHGKDVFLTEALTREMSVAIDDAVGGKQPFFAYMAHYAVHAPFEADERFTANYPDLKGADLAFATLVEGMDKSLGDLLDHLEKTGEASRTLVVFYSDNGSDGPPNLPLRGKKGTRFEGGTRVPLIVAWAKPDADEPMQKALPIPRGSVDDDLITPADFLPTLASAAGIPVPAKLDGFDLTADFKGTPGTHRPQQFLLHFPHGRHNNTLFTTWTDGDWKLIYQYAERDWQLVNTAFDIGEKNNLVNEKPDLALAMAKGMIAVLDKRQVQYPIDRKTGQPLKPDLTPLKRALAGKQAAAKPSPFDEDDLDLSSMIRPVGEANIYREQDWFTWCNSIVRGKDGRYHLFYVRWPKRYRFNAWLTHSEVARAVSRHPAGPYQFAGTVIPSRGSQSWNQFNAHNVKVCEFGGRYYLYSIGCNDGGRGFTEDHMVEIARGGHAHPDWMPLRNNQRTGVAIANSVEGPWEIQPNPVVEPNGPVSTVSVNPAVWRAVDGSYRMIFKGDYPPSRVAEAVAVSDSPIGPFRVREPLAFDRYSEDVSVWTDGRRGLTYGILHDMKGFAVIASKDGFAWRDARNFRAVGKEVPKAGGGRLVFDRFERPNIYVENGKPMVLCGAAQTGRGKDAFIVLIPLEETKN